MTRTRFIIKTKDLTKHKFCGKIAERYKNCGFYYLHSRVCRANAVRSAERSGAGIGSFATERCLWQIERGRKGAQTRSIGHGSVIDDYV